MKKTAKKVDPDTLPRIASLSYGKDSIATLIAIEKLGWRLDRIITIDVMATDTVPAPWYQEILDWRKWFDGYVLDRWGIPVEHLKTGVTVDSYVRRRKTTGKYAGDCYGLPTTLNPWCNRELKRSPLKRIMGKAGEEYLSYIGIAADEDERLERGFETSQGTSIFPLKEIGWTEADCMRICEEEGILPPDYKYKNRSCECFFCPNQTIGELRTLRKDYPELWQLMLDWGKVCSFPYQNGKYMNEFERAFALEDKGIIDPNKPIPWKKVVFQYDDDLNFIGEQSMEDLGYFKGKNGKYSESLRYRKVSEEDKS